MKKILILLTLATLLLAGCSKSTNTPIVKDETNSQLQEVIPPSSAASEALKANAKVQAQFTSEEAKMYAYIKAENLNGCTSLTIDNLIENCSTSIYMNQAINSGDKSICNKIDEQSSKDTCLSLVVEE